LHKTKTLRVINGKYGTAYHLELKALFKSQEATLCTWFISIAKNHPCHHPFWDKYLLSVIHLRDIEGEEPARKDYPEAEYELMVHALNPEKNPTHKDRETWQLLRPVNIQEQFHGVDDDQAAYIGELAAKTCIDAYLFIEPEGIRGAREFWTKAIAGTIDHFTNPNHDCKCTYH